MSGVRVLVGTRKGAFVLISDGKRAQWEVNGPFLGGWEIYHLKGSPVDPNRIRCPVFNIVSTVDRIVPLATACDLGTRLSIDAGHVGMVVGSRAPHIMWEPLRGWLLRLRNNC